MISSGSRVSSTCFVKPIQEAQARTCSRSPRSMDVREVHEPRRLVERGDLHGLRVEDLPDLVADGVVDRLRVELARDRVLHAVDQRQLGVPLPRLVHQPRVLERHAQAAGERLQQLLVGLAERVLAVDVLQRDHAGRLRRRRSSGTKSADFAGSPPSTRVAVPLALGREVLVDQERLARLEHVLAEADRAAIGSSGQPFATLDHVREAQQAPSPRRRSRCRRPARRRSPGSCRRRRRRSPACSSSPASASCTLLISASSAFRCRVSCTSRAFSSATLRLPASVVSRRTSVSVNAFVRSRFCSEIRPLNFVAGDQWGEEHGLRRLALRRRASARPARGSCAGTSLIEDRSLRLDHLPVRPRVLDGRRLVGKADTPLDRVRVARQLGGKVEDADVDDLGVEDLLDLVADDVVDRLHLELARERLLDAVDQRQLGVPLPRLVHEPRVLERDAQAACQRVQ